MLYFGHFRSFLERKALGGIDCPSLPFLLDGFHTELNDDSYFNTYTQQSRGVPSVSLGDELGHCHLLLTIILFKSLLPRAISETLRWMLKTASPRYHCLMNIYTLSWKERNDKIFHEVCSSSFCASVCQRLSPVLSSSCHTPAFSFIIPSAFPKCASFNYIIYALFEVSD